ncbi:class I SAM-dependent methyltransferase [Pseudoflavitalea sp. X16]|uniref:class I SAM-dependent methyltransferase n=1 Tax=Paraflavitalea devenefica TaxID=2716334 RepID=UPI001423FC40|nr:class I SAM-dependent methyltransferase [Paraflavitalea devenefica]NII24086.1 class I SAM-dependent methyltransferase [Paraflavitalea devenefica]
MKNKVAEIIKDQAYQKNGSKVVFTSAIDFEEATFIDNLIRELRPQNTIEIGCAEGASSLVIMDALASSGGQHTIIDPFQTTYWESKGINLLQMFGHDQYKLIEKGSEIALPALLDKAEKFDFAFIDGYHTFDHTLLDAFYLVKMLKPGGVLVIDDVQMPAINKCLRYLYNYPCLQYKGSSMGTSATKSRKLFDKVKGGVQLISGIIPQKWRSELLNDSVLRSDVKLGLRSSMVAFQKTAEDTREWNWWKSF